MFVVRECIDNPGTGEFRAAALDARRACLESQPGTPRGSLPAIEAGDVQGARDAANGGPIAAGAFSDLKCGQFKPKINSLG